MKKSGKYTIPPFLKKGDTLGILAPARKISLKEVSEAIRVFTGWGLEVVLSPHLFNEDHQYSGTDEQRIADLQFMLDHPDIRAIVCARGGYGSMRLIDHLDFSRFIKKPKWIAGFSDITVLHSHIHQQYGICTLHAMMPVNIVKGDAMKPRAKALKTLKESLFGNTPSFRIKNHKLNRNGNASGILTGGNLSLLYALQGSVSDIDTEGKILLIEDLDEYLYHIDRMMLSLKRAGKLAKLKGLIIGGMSDMRDNKIPFGKNACEIIAETVAEYRYPVCFGFPAGHIDDNRALILGSKVRLEVTPNGSLLEYL